MYDELFSSSGHTPSASPARDSRRTVLAAAAWLAWIGLVRAEELTADRLFDASRITDVQIEIPVDDWNELRRQSRDFRTAFTNSNDKPFSYFRGNLTIDGVRIESVGIRKKGFLGSLDDNWPSLKINFDEYVSQDPIPGVDTLTLNNNKQDPSLLSQFLTYRLFNAAGIAAPRVAYARVTVNGEYLGVYSNVESVGKPFLQRRFGESAGKLYEGTLNDFHPSALANLQSKINRSSRGSGAPARLARLLAGNEPLNLAEVEELVDLDAFLRFWALESLIVFWDGYCNNQNNFWVYERSDGRLYFMPWGADMAFAGGEGFLGFGGVAVYAESMLANRLYRTEGIPARYRETMLSLLETVWKEDELLKAIDDVEALVGGRLHKRQTSAIREMKTIRRFIKTRRDGVTKLLNKGPTKVAEAPRKPAYSVPVGRVEGTFSTVWSDEPIPNPLDVGAADLRMTLNNEEVVFERLGVAAHPAPRDPFSGPGGGPPRRGGNERSGSGRPDSGGRGDEAAGDSAAGPDATANASGAPADLPPARIAVVVAGIRAANGQKQTLTLIIERALFAKSAGESIPVKGSLMVGNERFSFFTPFAGRSVAGTLKLTEVGVGAGDRIAGELELTISETHGGFAGRRGPGGAKPPAPPKEEADSQ